MEGQLAAITNLAVVTLLIAIGALLLSLNNRSRIKHLATTQVPHPQEYRDYRPEPQAPVSQTLSQTQINDEARRLIREAISSLFSGVDLMKFLQDGTPEQRKVILDRIREKLLDEVGNTVDDVFDTDNSDWCDEYEAFRKSVAGMIPEIVKELFDDPEGPARKKVVEVVSGKITEYLDGDMS